MSSDKGSPLPKFGEWDVNNPASAEGFTVIFTKARDQKKVGSGIDERSSRSDVTGGKHKQDIKRGSTRMMRWLCCG